MLFTDAGICNELIACLSAIGISLGLSPTFLGLTVLAWGNSIGDLFSDVTMAKNGMPTTAIAGCYAGPLFNMVFGLGISVTIKTLQIYPEEISFIRNTSVVTSYGALAIGLIGMFIDRVTVFFLGEGIYIWHNRGFTPFLVCIFLDWQQLYS